MRWQPVYRQQIVWTVGGTLSRNVRTSSPLDYGLLDCDVV